MTATSLLRRHAVDTRPMQIPPYRRLLLGQGTAFIGSMLTQVAVPVQVYAISGSSLYVGLVGLAGLLPIVIFGLYGGAIADAVDRRRLFVASSVGAWVVTLALLAQTLLNLSSVGLILGLVVVQSAMFAVSSSTRGAIIPRIVPTDLVPAANTLNYTVGTFGGVVGPLLAGVVVSLNHGFAYAYAIDAALFLAALYTALRLPAIPPDGSLGRPGLRSVIDGLRFIAARPVLIMSFGVDIVAMVLAMPRAVPRSSRRAVSRDGRPAVRGDRDRLAAGRHVERMDRAGEPPGRRPDRRGSCVGSECRDRRAGPPAMARGAAARRGRSCGPGERGVPADDPADVRAGRDARPHAGSVHRRRRRWATAGRSACGCDGRGDHRDDLLGRWRHRVRGSGDSGGAGGAVVLEILHACH